MTAPLRRQVFRALGIASVASNVGTWMQEVGAAWLMTTLTPSPLSVTLIQAGSSLPMFFLAIPSGALADIVDRRRMLIATQTWMLAAAATLGVVTLTGHVTPAALLLVTFAMGFGVALNGPAWQAVVSELVPRDELPAAVALNSVGFNLARAVGPALGGLIVAAAGPGATFLLNAARSSARFSCSTAGIDGRRARRSPPSDSPAPCAVGSGTCAINPSCVR